MQCEIAQRRKAYNVPNRNEGFLSLEYSTWASCFLKFFMYLSAFAKIIDVMYDSILNIFVVIALKYVQMRILNKKFLKNLLNINIYIYLLYFFPDINSDTTVNELILIYLIDNIQSKVNEGMSRSENEPQYSFFKKIMIIKFLRNLIYQQYQQSPGRVFSLLRPLFPFPFTVVSSFYGHYRYNGYNDEIWK